MHCNMLKANFVCILNNLKTNERAIKEYTNCKLTKTILNDRLGLIHRCPIQHRIDIAILVYRYLLIDFISEFATIAIFIYFICIFVPNGNHILVRELTASSLSSSRDGARASDNTC